MTGNSHSAAGQAVGYVYQCQWALIALGQRAPLESSVQLRLELLDDIQLDSISTAIELVQVKHHLQEHAPITSQSVDLWKSLNVWMDIESLNDLALRLITTQEIRDESCLMHLRDDDRRDPQLALAGLVDAARSSNSASTRQSREKFLALDEIAQLDLLSRVVILDGSPSALDVEQELVRIFRYAIPLGKESVFVHLLLGWWSGISKRLLTRSLGAVAGYDLIVQVNDIVDQLKCDTLPVDPAVFDTDYDDSIVSSFRERRFVQQLIWIALDNDRLWKAIRDYHRSFTQRSFWLRHQLVGETELNRFAFRLHDEWEQIFDLRVSQMRMEGREDYEIVGQSILDELALESRARLRDRFHEAWFNRGTFHAIADGELGHQIGWHPDFQRKLTEVLADVGA